MPHIESAQLTPASKDEFNLIIEPKSELFREVALQLISMIHPRIHHDGLAADGTPIGTYSDAYMKVRTGNYASSPKYSRGAKKGKANNAGTISRGPNKGRPRPNYNRSADTKVILSLTRQMENDYAVLPGDIGWGIGFNNEHNFDKATWNNDRYNHIVYDLTQEEEKEMIDYTEKLITEKFK